MTLWCFPIRAWHADRIISVQGTLHLTIMLFAVDDDQDTMGREISQEAQTLGLSCSASLGILGHPFHKNRGLIRCILKAPYICIYIYIYIYICVYTHLLPPRRHDYTHQSTIASLSRTGDPSLQRRGVRMKV